MPVGALVLAAYSNDIFKLVFKELDLETSSHGLEDLRGNIATFIPGHMPYSHGLVMSLVWAIVAAALAYFIYKERQSALVVGLVVSCHWLLDFIVHPPELPLFFGNSHLVGLSLWATETGYRIAWSLEIAMLAAGLVLYILQSNRAFVPAIKTDQ